jgi:hypothetical protein
MEGRNDLFCRGGEEQSISHDGIGGEASLRVYRDREIPRLWRGGSRSLTFTGVHPRNSRREPTKAHVKAKLDGPIGESKSVCMGVQIPRSLPPEMPTASFV